MAAVGEKILKERENLEDWSRCEGHIKMRCVCVNLVYSVRDRGLWRAV